jgi:hypothetical protein
LHIYLHGGHKFLPQNCNNFICPRKNNVYEEFDVREKTHTSKNMNVLFGIYQHINPFLAMNKILFLRNTGSENLWYMTKKYGNKLM